MSASRNVPDPSRHELPGIHKSPYQKLYMEAHDELDFRALSYDVVEAILKFSVKADDSGPVFEDAVRLPVDVQSGGGVVTSYVPMTHTEGVLKSLRQEIELAVGRQKLRAGCWICSVDHMFAEEQMFYPCPYREEDNRFYPSRQHWLAEHFGVYRGGLWYCTMNVADDAVFPYELSPTDISLRGLMGLVDYGGCQLLMRRLLSLTGIACFWARSLGDRLDGHLRRKARMRNQDGKKVLALPVGGVLEAIVRDLGLLDAPDLFRIAFLDYDPVLCSPRSRWCLHLPVTSLMKPSFGPVTELVPRAPEDTTEWNEFGCVFDKCDQNGQYFLALCQQAVPYIVACEQMGLDLDELLDSTPYRRTGRVGNGDRLIKREVVKDFLATLPPRIESLEHAVKRGFIAKANEIYEGYDMVSLLPMPEAMVLPCELYRRCASNCFLPENIRNRDEFVAFHCATRLIGSSFCQMREGFIKLAHAFQKCHPCSLSYSNGSTDTPIILREAISVENFNRKRAGMEGGSLIYTTAPEFMFSASFMQGPILPQSSRSIFRDSFPDDELPRQFDPDYPDGQT